MVSEACIGVLGIQDVCNFTSRDMGYYPFYFQEHDTVFNTLFYIQGYWVISNIIKGVICHLPVYFNGYRIFGIIPI